MSDPWFGIANYRRYGHRRKVPECTLPIIVGMSFAAAFMALGMALALVLWG